MSKGRRRMLIEGWRGTVWKSARLRRLQAKENALQEYFWKTKMRDLRR